jgi:hypothetical protein
MPTDNPLSEVPPAEFVAARNALTRELRAKGKPEEARRVAALRRPSPALWIVNQVAKRAAGSVEELIESTNSARRAQIHGRGGDELRAAMKSQHASLQRLLHEAAQAAAQIGVDLTPLQERRIQDTLQTAAATQPDALREGTLQQELSPAGFSALLSGAEPVAAKDVSRKRDLGTRTEPKRDLEARTQHKRHLEARAQEQKRLTAEKRERMVRQREVQRAQREARRLIERAERLEKVAEQARSAADQARTKAAEARRAANEAAARLLQLQKG